MADILKEILKKLPKGKISEATFEAANIVLYTKDRTFFLENKDLIRKLVDEFKKRIELRPDPTLTINQDNATRYIKKTMPTEAKLGDIIYDPPRSIVIIHVEKPGLAIGKQGFVLKQIREETMWVPVIKRMPPIKSKITDDIRSTLYENADYRKKFLNKVGHRIYDGWTKEKRQNWVRVTFLGGGRQVGRSCILLQTPESKVMLDCGIDVSKNNEDMYPIFDVPEFNIQQLDAVIISHAHTDHTGILPYLYRMGYRGPVYCTSPTRDIMSLLQLDTIKIAHNEGKTPPYSSEQVKETVLHTITIEWEQVTDITPDVRLTFYNSGHILGSSMIHLNIGNGFHNLLYTGDIKFLRTNLLEPAHTQFPRMESMIIEATYGGRDNMATSPQESDKKTAELITKVVERGGKVLLPTLGSGRAQEVIVIVDKLVKEGKIPKIPIYVDGMLWDITAIYTAYPEYLNRNVRNSIFHKEENPFLSDMITRVGSGKERKQIVDSKCSCIIMATSGMLSGGPSVEYFKLMSENKKHMLLFSCYQGEGTLGRRVQNGEREFIFKNNGKNVMHTLKMEVGRLEVSGHADRKELMNFVGKCNPTPRKVILNHGENIRCLDLASSLHKQYRIETTSPKNLESIRLR